VSTERAEFDAALGELREGRYPEAVGAWRRFLGAHPSGDLAGDAQYWLGEACYLSRDYNAAKEAFIALGLNHPQNARLPDALLKLGYIYGELGDNARAREVLQKLGPVRYWITAFLFMTMVGTCLKVLLRLAFNIKYVFASPWINV